MHVHVCIADPLNDAQTTELPSMLLDNVELCICLNVLSDSFFCLHRGSICTQLQLAGVRATCPMWFLGINSHQPSDAKLLSISMLTLSGVIS